MSRYNFTDDDLGADTVLDPSWLPVDLGPYLSGKLARVTPGILRRDDGVAIFYPGRINWAHADSGTGKTWVAVIAAAAELNSGSAVLWIDYEEPGPDVLIERLRLVGATDKAIGAHLIYINPKVEMGLLAVEHLVTLIATRNVTLAVLDSLGEAFAEAGVNEDRDNEVGPWCRAVLRPLADAGAGVLVIDHATKAADNPLHPSGSKRKRAAVTGLSVLVEATVALTREHGGKLRLVCAKDRHGTFRKGVTVAEIELVAWPDGSSTVHVVAPEIVAPKPHTNVDVDLIVRALEILDDETAPADGAERAWLSQRRWIGLMRKAALQFRDDRFRQMAEAAEHVGSVKSQAGPRNSTLYRYVRAWPSK